MVINIVTSENVFQIKTSALALYQLVWQSEDGESTVYTRQPMQQGFHFAENGNVTIKINRVRAVQRGD
jgi:hypothetical protein